MEIFPFDSANHLKFKEITELFGFARFLQKITGYLLCAINIDITDNKILLLRTAPFGKGDGSTEPEMT
jgi:hypothetical protein